MSSRNYTNIIELTIDDFNRKLKDEMSKTDRKPNYNIKFKHGINKSYHKEFSPISFDNQNVTFILFNKERDKTINLSLKFSISNSSSLNVLANLITVSLRENTSTQFKLISSSHSSTHNVFTNSNPFESPLSSFEMSILNITIHVDYIQSFLQDFILLDFNSLYSDTKLKGVTKNNLFLILQSTFKKYSSEDQLVYTLSIWLECEYNLQENVENLIELISWHNVSLDKIFEFVIKFSIILEKHNLSMFFTDIINEKINQAFDKKDSKLIGSMISEALFDSSNRVNFIQILNNMYLKDKLIANSTTNITPNCNKSSINNQNESNSTPFLLKYISDPARELQALKLEEPISDIKALPFLSSNISKISNNFAEEPFSERSLYSNKTNIIEEENGKSTLTKRNKINSLDTISKKTINKPSFYNSKPSPLNIEGNTNKKNLEKLIKKVKEKNAFSPLKICNCRKHKNENCCSPFKKYTVYLNSNQSIQTSKTNSTEK